MMSMSLGVLDRRLLAQARALVGVDEVGRGALAGPVVVAGVVWSSIPENAQIRDSKAMTARQREHASVWIRKSCDAWTIVEIWPALIDRFNILGATRLAMRTVVRRLVCESATVVVDAVSLGEKDLDVRSETKADARYFCVASASIVAKVHRDRIMVELAARYDGWGWHRNKGYGTAEHRNAVANIGRSFLHRKSFQWHRVLP